MTYARGTVVYADLGYGEKPWLIVSNNARNGALGSALVVRITTSGKPPLDSIVELTSADHPLVGRVLCDDVETLWDDDSTRPGGALSPETMMRVDRGLRVAFALR